METLKDAYCRTFSCHPRDFERCAFAATLYPHARAVAFFFGYWSAHFAADRALIGYCGDVRSHGELKQELVDYSQLPENRRFSRQVLRLRISGYRLERMAARCWTE